MNIIYISSACFRDDKKFIDQNATIKLENNIINFHNAIIDGIRLQNDIENIFSIFGLPISIQTNKKIFWKKKYFCHNNINYFQVGFINLPIFKQLIIKHKFISIIKKILKKYNNCVIIYDASYVSVIPNILKVAKKYDVKTVGIFADIYDYMFDVKRKSNKLSLLKIYFRKMVQKAYISTDYYVFLTQAMNNLVNKEHKPYIVMEGIYYPAIKNNCDIDKINKSVMYAGGLSNENGVKYLVDAFCSIDDDITLYIFGTGELVDYIKSKTSKHIVYGGLIDNNQIQEMERKVELLINPRITSNQFTNYSFPSKLIEYMASGTPVLTTKLSGIPNEYYNYFYTLDDESSEGLKLKLVELFSLPKKEFYNKGEIAKKFILKEKNYSSQANRIIDLIKMNWSEK